MGKKNKSTLGKSILKDRFRATKGARQGESWLHSSELNDGVDDTRFTISSITEQSDLDEFLASAQLAGTEFTAEKLNVSFVNPQQIRDNGLLSDEKVMHIKKAQEENKTLLRIPRRPEWNKSMTAQELDLKERDSFLEWRRELAMLQDKEHIIMTPFEKNLEFWRQLWRVIERSDVVVQIVDARNPLLFRCEDLAVYVKEVNPLKSNLVLINKADFLTPSQRNIWAEYFKQHNIQIAFWSALEENERLEKENESCEDENQELTSKVDDDEDDDEDDEDDNDDDDKLKDDDTILTDRVTASLSEIDLEKKETKVNLTGSSEKPVGDTQTSKQTIDSDNRQETNSKVDSQRRGNNNDQRTCDQGNSAAEDDSESATPSSSHTELDLITSNELIDMCQRLHHSAVGGVPDGTLTTIGLVGYPNVGKSSTINTILQAKKVPVSSTPGRTKHFQTLQLSPSVCLCDCPGLVFPSFVSTKAEMVVNGILPIDQMRDHIPPVTLVCQRIPRQVLEGVYGVNIAPPMEGEEPDRAPHADELLNAYGYMRGYMTSSGTPDCPRSSRYILKDYVKGKLMYCTPPPDVDSCLFQENRHATGKYEDIETLIKHKPADGAGAKPKMSQTDTEFFEEKSKVRCFSKGLGVAMAGRTGADPVIEGDVYKPWKKHNNKNKREKLRRLAKN